MSRLSKAHPQIADYPFTTKYPNLGICRLGEERTCVLADIPGLIEGAHAGAGLGHEFLRHVERTRVLVHLVEALPVDGSSPVENYRVVRSELESYNPELASKPELLVVSKRELTDVAPIEGALRSDTGKEPISISAVTGEGLRELSGAISSLLDQVDA